MQKQYPDSYLREQRAERVSNSLGEDEMADVRKHMIFHGRVQGVGFRYTAKYLARSMNLTGYSGIQQLFSAKDNDLCICTHS